MRLTPDGAPFSVQWLIVAWVRESAALPRLDGLAVTLACSVEDEQVALKEPAIGVKRSCVLP